MKDISLVIINEDSELYLDRLFSSIKQQKVFHELDIIFIDNNSKDNSILIAQKHGVSKIISTSERVSSKGLLYNLGQELAEREFILFTHSDIFFFDDFFENLDSYLISNQTDFINFNQVYLDGFIFGCHQLSTDVTNEIINYAQLYQNSPNDSELVLQCSESCFMVRNRVFKKFKFDHEYYDSLFEYSFLIQVILSKYTISFIKQCKIYHYFLEMSDKVKSLKQDKRTFLLKNKTLFLSTCLQNSSGLLTGIKEKIIGKKIIIFGAGGNGKMLFYALRNDNLEVECFLDNSESKWGGSFNGVSIHSPRFLLDINSKSYIILIASMQYEGISQQLKDMELSENEHFLRLFY
ncbi:glycosyltransferase [Paenibacillus sp. MSJ-34]|uniref:glycosyltransferase n=1 Tax=Paenibacillus sp. MSJ-34 TaxID=2841529 RepID=UPI001C106300|nr:glycosyltransferase [Paenibacillus sp. MSJ-34]MBU5440998.1 glycosyltransferase [Paenibacillus sp. MSJ-34]